MRVPTDGVSDMAQEFTYYEQPTWWFTKEEIGRGLRERYQVPNEVPPKLLALVRKLAAAESNQLPRSRRLISKLDAIEGNYLSRARNRLNPEA